MADPTYAHAVTVSHTELLWSAGALPVDADGQIVGGSDYAAQTRQVASNLTAVLTARSMSVADVVKTTVYVRTNEAADLATVWEALGAVGLASQDIATAMVGVAILGLPGQLVEVEAVAAR